MACKYICDGCGKEAAAVFYKHGDRQWHKPESWFQRRDEEGPQDACCRECVDLISKNSGKTRVILPF